MLKRTVLSLLSVALLASSSHSATANPSRARSSERAPNAETVRRPRAPAPSVSTEPGPEAPGELRTRPTRPGGHPSTPPIAPVPAVPDAGRPLPRTLRLPERATGGLGALRDRIPDEVENVVRHFQGEREAGAIQMDADGLRFSPLGFIPTSRSDPTGVRGYAYEFDVFRVEFQGLSP